MSSVDRIAHFSDFHLSDTGQEFGRAVNLVRHALSLKVDHVVITGDLVDVTQTDVISAFWGRLRPLGWSGGTRMSFCPGNHDVFPVSTRPP
jgi:3',5'-cyclic AMP phosphodiesterase CpdA